MAWYQIFYDICNNLGTRNKNKTEGTMKDKSLYELSQNPAWKEKWQIRHRDFGANIPLTTPLGRAIISNPLDSRKLVESTYALRQGQSKPFTLSNETISLISKF